MRGVLEIHHVDVGQGDGTVILYKDEEGTVERCAVIDGGHTTPGGQTIHRYLLKLGISKINFFVCAHTDADHIEGVTYLLKTSLFDKTESHVFWNDDGNNDNKVVDFKKSAGDRLKNVSASASNPTTLFLSSDPNRTRLTHPYIECRYANQNGNNNNNKSIASMLVFKSFKYFTAGDLEKDCEKLLFTKKEHVCAFKAGHHGSKSSTDDALLENATPTLAFISCGMNDSYYHPDQEVINRLHESESILGFYLTNCYYNRQYVNKDYVVPQSQTPVPTASTTRTLRAVVAGDTQHLGTLVLRVLEEDALNEQFEALYWDGADQEVKRRVYNCKTRSRIDMKMFSVQRKRIQDSVNIDELADIDLDGDDTMVSARIAQRWKENVNQAHKNKHFSLPEKRDAKTGSSKREKEPLPKEDLDFIEAEKLEKPFQKKNRKSTVSNVCSECGEDLGRGFPSMLTCSSCDGIKFLHPQCHEEAKDQMNWECMTCRA
ncbi:ComEC/Rec2 family competence protein [Archangium lansingense]|uniref:ComEC/Rec2 family competence protein n=1 Tax=Archangium lansingense TaxID=2995310 RepID=UPI003B7B77C3